MIDPIKVIIVGMGERAAIYAREALTHPEQLQIVGVADVSHDRVRLAQERFSIPKKYCFSSAEELAAHPKFADAVISWADNIWHDCGCDNCSETNRVRILSEKNNPYSRCIYRCDLQVVDHQSVLVCFANGATGTFSITEGAAASGRHIHITGTKGESKGTFEEQRFTISHIAPEADGGKASQVIDVSTEQRGNAHGGGDQAIVRDFIALLSGAQVSPCCTTLDDSMTGHQLVFLAERSRKRRGETQHI